MRPHRCVVCAEMCSPVMGLNARNPLKLPKGARICPRCFDNSLGRGLKWHKITPRPSWTSSRFRA